MVSINNNSASVAALRNLQATSAALSQTQNRIATGLKVASAKDDASIWKISQTLKSEISGNESIRTAVETMRGRVDVAAVGYETISTLLGDLKTKLVAAQSADATGRTALAADIAVIQNQLKTVANQSEFNGVNWLTGGTTNNSVTLGYAETSGFVTATLTLTADFEITNGTDGLIETAGAESTLTVVAYTVASGTTAAEITDMLTDLDAVIGKVDTVAATVGGFASRLESQGDFLDRLEDVKTAAIGRLVDADMGEESSRLQALQVREQLAYQSLQIANSSVQNILRLFQ